MLLKGNDHILFYGDSITDAGRTGPLGPYTAQLGAGHAFLCATRLWARYPELNLRVTNTGISGNRVFDLEARLDCDLLAHKPTVVAILIGINDTWRRYDSNMISAVPDFLACYRRMLERISEELKARLVIMEPFLLPVPEDRRKWREDLDPRIAAVRDVTREFGACYVPLDGIFAAAACVKPPEYWAPDGVHPTPAGYGLIAEAWMAAVAGCRG